MIKYVIPNYPEGFGINYGAANVVQSIAIMMSYVDAQVQATRRTLTLLSCL